MPSAQLTVSITIEQSSATVAKTKIQETKEFYTYKNKDGKEIVVILHTLTF